MFHVEHHTASERIICYTIPRSVSRAALSAESAVSPVAFRPSLCGGLRPYANIPRRFCEFFL